MTSGFRISKRLLIANSLSSTAAQALQFSVLVWLHQHLLRRISPDEYVLLPLVMGIISFIPLFTGILTTGLGRYLVDAYARGDEERMSGIVSTMVPLLLVAALLLLLLGAAIAWRIDGILAIPPALIWDARLMILLLVLSLAIQLPCAPMGVGLYVRQMFVMSSLVITISEIVKSTVLLVLLLLVSTRVLWVALAMAVAQMTALTINMLLSLRALPSLRFRWNGVDWGIFRAITGFGGWNFLLGVSSRVREYAVPLILNHLGTAADVAAFHVGGMPRRQIDQWFDVATRPVYPIITGMNAVGAGERLQNAYLRGGRVGLWIILLVALPAMIFARRIIDLYVGSAYADTAGVLIFTLACYVLSAGGWMTWGVANARAQMRRLSMWICLTQLVGVTVVLGAAVWLRLGAIGAAMVTFVVNALSVTCVSLPIGLRLAEVSFESWIRKTLVPGVAPGCIAAVAWVALDLWVKPDSWLELGWCTAIGALVYVAVLLGWCLGPQDKQDLAVILLRAKPSVA